LITSDPYYVTTDTQRIPSTPASPKKSHNFKNNRKKDHKNSLSTCVFSGLAMCP